ncbi:hypothetical protein [Nocardioides plantarum]|uniref:Uncharacterized protein n=1 Tax=Nocardioides plantarum TaxID=29299 RepID=A0ABV5KF46_9ACTN|nr:hypothetical protein [Nocardioides plantarum]
MNTQRRQRWLVLVGAAVLVGTGLGPVATPGPAGADDGEQRTTQRTADGMVVETITRGDTTVTTYGASGAQVQWEAAGPDEALVGVTMPTSPSSGSTLASDAVAPTVYEMSLASGMSAAQACEFARDLDAQGCRTSAQVEAAATRTAATPTAATPTSATPTAATRTAGVSAAASSIHDSFCYDFKTTKGDGTKYNHACVVRYLDASNSKYVWMANKMKATGWVKNPGAMYDRLKGVGIRLEYVSERSTAVDWDPYSSESIGSCRSTDVSVEGKNGASYSSSTEMCPDRLNPWASEDFQYFGAKWTSSGQAPADETRGVVATSLQRISKGSAGGSRASIHAWLKWS